MKGAQGSVTASEYSPHNPKAGEIPRQYGCIKV